MAPSLGSGEGAPYANGALVIECLYLQLLRHNFPHSLELKLERMYVVRSHPRVW